MVVDHHLDYYAIENTKKLEWNYPLNTNNDMYINRSIQGNPRYSYLLSIQRNTSGNELTSTIIFVYNERNACDLLMLKEVLSDLLPYYADNNTIIRN